MNSIYYHWAHIKTLVLGYIEYALDWVYMPQDLSDPITSQEYDYSTQVDDQPTDTICDLAGSVSREGGWESLHAYQHNIPVDINIGSQYMPANLPFKLHHEQRPPKGMRPR